MTVGFATRKEMIRATQIAFDELSAGAKLSPQKAKQFVQKIREKATLKPYIEVLPIDDSNKLIMPWIEAPDQVMGEPQGLLNPADYNMSWVTTGDNEVETFPVEVIVFVQDDWKTGNFAGQSGWDIAFSLIGAQFLANMEQAAFYSNPLGPAIKESEVKKTGSTSNYIKHAVRSHYNGWLEQMESGIVVDAENSDDMNAVMGNALMAIPTRYEEAFENAKWFVPSQMPRIHRMNLTQSPTALGDLARNGKLDLQPLGYDFQAVPLLATRPWHVEHVQLTGTTPKLLQYKPIVASELIVLPSDLANTATAPYISGTDYEFTEATASLVRPSSGSNITSGNYVKAFYRTPTKFFLTFPKNLVLGVTRDIEFKQMRYELASGTFYMIKARVGYTMLNKDANIMIKNFKCQPKTIA